MQRPLNLENTDLSFSQLVQITGLPWRKIVSMLRVGCCRSPLVAIGAGLSAHGTQTIPPRESRTNANAAPLQLGHMAAFTVRNTCSAWKGEDIYLATAFSRAAARAFCPASY
jgi:hypothetical protein